MSLMIESWIDWLNIGGLAWLILVIRFYTSVSSQVKVQGFQHSELGRSLQRV